MADWVSVTNTYLTLEQMQVNAGIINEYFTGLGWTTEAVAGMLGNMQSESTINPDIWQGRSTPDDIYTSGKGYGLTQWTPGSKMITWADESGLDYKLGDTQVARISYEVDNNLQWSTNNFLHYTWQDYIHSTRSPADLARVFVWGYERPADPNVALRQDQAEYWYSYLQGRRYPRKKMPVWMMLRKWR